MHIYTDECRDFYYDNKEGEFLIQVAFNNQEQTCSKQNDVESYL